MPLAHYSAGRFLLHSTLMMLIPEVLSIEFESLDAVRTAIQSFVIDQGESFKVSYVDRTRYIVICCDAFCKFSIHASLLKGLKYRVTQYTPHSCSPITYQNFRFAHSVSFLAEQNRISVVQNREIHPTQIRATERIQYSNSGVSYS